LSVIEDDMHVQRVIFQVNFFFFSLILITFLGFRMTFFVIFLAFLLL
jgi:hypothetical protein